MTRKKILEEFLNDSVYKLHINLYSWRGILYEIMPYKQILRNKKLKASHFVKHLSGKTLYGIREISPETYKKHYSRTLPIDK